MSNTNICSIHSCHSCKNFLSRMRLKLIKFLPTFYVSPMMTVADSKTVYLEFRWNYAIAAVHKSQDGARLTLSILPLRKLLQ